MSDNGRGILGDPEATGEQIRRAWEHAAVEAMKVHQRTGVPVTTWDWENNRIVQIPADEIIISNGHLVGGKSTSSEEGR